MQRALLAGDGSGSIGDGIARAAVATGAVAILAVGALVLLFTAGSAFGRANDVLNGAAGVMSAVLAVVVYRATGGSPLPVVLAVTGAVITVVGSWMVLSGTTGFQFAGFVSAVGFALIGAWLLLATSGSHGLGEILPVTVTRLGWAAGALMLVGLLGVAGVAMGIDAAADMPGWLWLYGLGWLGTYVVYPAWCMALARAA